MNTNWREPVKAASEILALGIMAMGLVAATGAALLFWELALVAR